jgi:hypothetical protein
MTPVNQTNLGQPCILELEDLRNQNILFQAVSRYQVCLEQPTHSYLQLVSSNTLQNWINYFSINNHIYSKGLERLNIWRNIFNSNHLLSLITQTRKYFVLSALIVLFQVYGDGNHRTATYFYNKHTGGNLNLSLINDLVIEFSILNVNSINHLIDNLIIISELQD